MRFSVFGQYLGPGASKFGKIWNLSSPQVGLSKKSSIKKIRDFEGFAPAWALAGLTVKYNCDSGCSAHKKPFDGMVSTMQSVLYSCTHQKYTRRIYTFVHCAYVTHEHVRKKDFRWCIFFFYQKCPFQAQSPKNLFFGQVTFVLCIIREI